MKFLLIVLMYCAATTYAGPITSLIGGLTNNRPRYGSAGGSSNSKGLLGRVTNSAPVVGTGSSGGLFGGLLGGKPSSALPPLEDVPKVNILPAVTQLPEAIPVEIKVRPAENVAPVINVPYPVENIPCNIDDATKVNIADVAVTRTSETVPVKDEPKTSFPVENVSPPVDDVQAVTVLVQDVTKTTETPIVYATDALPTNAVPLNDVHGTVTNSLPTVGTGSSGGLVAEVTQALPIGGGSSGLLTNFVGDLTKILPVGGLLGVSNGGSRTTSKPMANLITAPCALAMAFLTSLLPIILPFVIPIIQRFAALVSPLIARLGPYIDSVINQVGPAIFPIIRPLLPYLAPVYLQLLPHFIAEAPAMVPSLLQTLLGVQNVLPAALPAP